MFLYKSLNINTLKDNYTFQKHVRVFGEKVVHVFRETRTCFTESHDRETRAYMEIYNKPTLKISIR